MDKETKIGFALCALCVTLLSSQLAEQRAEIMRLRRVQKRLVEQHNKRVTDEKFVNIVKNYGRY